MDNNQMIFIDFSIVVIIEMVEFKERNVKNSFYTILFTILSLIAVRCIYYSKKGF